MSEELADFSDNPYQSPRSSRVATSRRSAKSSRSKDRVYVFKSVRLLGMILSVLFALTIITSVGILGLHKGPRQALLAVLFVESLLTLVLGIMFIVWFYKAYVNLPPLGVKKLDPSAGWAIGGWFIPFFSWYQPTSSPKRFGSTVVPSTPAKLGGPEENPVPLRCSPGGYSGYPSTFYE